MSLCGRQAADQPPPEIVLAILWEHALAFALRDALRSGNLYLAESRHYVSFWKSIYLRRDRRARGPRRLDLIVSMPSSEASRTQAEGGVSSGDSACCAGPGPTCSASGSSS